jgi:hypothetical protein
MSNIEDKNVENATSDLRKDDWKPLVKPTVHVDVQPTPTLTAEQIIAISKEVEKQTRAAVKEASFNPNMPAQILPKKAAPITDFSKLTMDAVYDLSVPIEAKAFMSADVLAFSLKDTNYEGRWVNKNPQNLGDKIAKGFTYVTPQDLVSIDSIQTGTDAEGHFCFHDVVAMKIDKATYYAALRAAHERALATTNQSAARKRAATAANDYMGQEAGNDYHSAAANKKMVFYDPDVSI